jgi:hypothetical protein
MLIKICSSILLKPIVLITALAFLFMSFKIQPDGEVELTAGTNVPLETISMIRSDQVSVGQSIDFRVKYDVKIGDKTVIAAGSLAKGQVMRAQRAKGLGKEGLVEIQIKSVKAVDGQDVFLSGGNVYNEGDNKEVLSILLGIFVCVLLLTIKGKNAEVPPGYQVTSGVATTMVVKV